MSNIVQQPTGTGRSLVGRVRVAEVIIRDGNSLTVPTGV